MSNDELLTTISIAGDWNKKKQQEMDGKRRQAQEELEARENKAKKARMEQSQVEAQHAAELARLRAEGAKRRQEDWNREQEEKRQREENEKVPEVQDIDLALKFKWKKKKHPLTTDDLTRLLTPLGATDVAALTEKRKGHTMVIFNTVVDAHAVLTSKDTNPSLAIFESIEWASGNEPAIITKMKKDEQRRKEAAAAMMENDTRPRTSTSSTSSPRKPLFNTDTSTSSFFKNIKIPSSTTQFSNASSLSHNDYEAITMMKLRQAEKDRLAKQSKD
ncbi:unnamed protein product [Absidia cylindrospora]